MLTNQISQNNTPATNFLPSVVDYPKPKTIILSELTKWERNKLFEKEIDKVIKQKGYKGSLKDVFKQIGYRIGIDLTSGVGQKKLAVETGYSVKTVERCYKRYVADKAVLYEPQGGWMDKKTNKTTMLCLQHLLPSVTDKMSYDLNTLTKLIDNNINNYITYDDYVIISNNSQKQKEVCKPKPKPKPKTFFNPETHIDEEKLNTNEADEEITRICLVHLLCSQDISYVKQVMKSHIAMRTKAGFLASMIEGLKGGGKKWNKVLPAKPIPEWREVEKAKEYEALQPDTEEGFKNVQKALAMLRNANKGLLNAN